MEVGDEGVAARAVLLAGIAPGDGIEEMLAEQMAACHDAALGCLAKARRADLPQSARTAELRTGARLMTLFTQQLGALERHRTHLRREQEAEDSAERAAELRREFAVKDAEREADEAVLYPERVARRRAARAALAPATDEAIFERLTERFKRRMNGQGAAADDGDLDPPTPDSVGAAAAPPAAPEPPLNRQQRRAEERRRRKQRRRAGKKQV